MYGLESEVAADFSMCSADSFRVNYVIGYGSYFNWNPGLPDVPAYNLRFYEDAGGVPGNVIATYLNQTGIAILIGYDYDQNPIYKIEFVVDVLVWGSPAVYWFGLQAADHPYPPQWGRQESTLPYYGSTAMFRSAFYGYPDWTPVSTVFGFTFDAAQEFG